MPLASQYHEPVPLRNGGFFCPRKGETMTALERCINFWQTTVDVQGYLVSPAMLVIVKDTIKHLEELKKIKGE